MGCGLTIEDVRFEVRRARRFGFDRIELRKRLACPCCTGSESFLPGPVLFELSVDWPSEGTKREQVEQVVADCVDRARDLGLAVAAE